MLSPKEVLMDFELLAKAAGCRPEAVEDTVRRLEARFQGETPSPEAVTQWLSTTLRQAAPHLWPEPETLWAKLGMDHATFDAMPPAWRLGQAMADQARTVPPHPRRPVPREAPAEMQEQWKDLPPAERLTHYRAWRDGQG
jgi:hypothetical protein